MKSNSTPNLLVLIAHTANNHLKIAVNSDIDDGRRHVAGTRQRKRSESFSDLVCAASSLMRPTSLVASRLYLNGTSLERDLPEKGETASMRSFIFFLGIVFGCAGLTSAQEESPLPQVEVGLTYSGIHLNAANNNSQITGNGGSGAFEYNINKWLGAVADLGGYANTRDGIEHNAFTYMFGPRFNWRYNRLTPYLQSLFGGANVWNGVNSNTQNTFALAIGGGVDYALTRHIAIKPLQVEYFLSQFNSERLGGATSSFGNHQNGVRYSAGVVFRFGSK